MSGISGAQVVLTDGAAHKRGGDIDRTINQGAWLSRNRARGLPVVLAFDAHGYTMERLEEGDGSPVVADVVYSLKRDVWSKPAEVEFDENALELKLSKIVAEYAPDLTPILSSILDNVFDASRTPVLSHGDPTAENIMYRESTGELVVIDPIPATPAVPDLLEVDCGKLLQSAIGWEILRGNTRVAAWTPHELYSALTPELFVNAAPWCAVHLIRTLPYTTQEVRDGVIKLFPSVLLGV